MLIAYTELQQPFLSYAYTKDELRSYRKKEKFYCPQCQQPVQLKIGTVNVPHFAHVANHACDKLFAEGESMLHLQGKMQLFEWLKKRAQNVALEPYLPKLAQRPDILVIKHKQPVAIEYQCSPITYEKWQMRTAGYEKEQIQALWLFQTPQKKRITPGIQKISIAPIMQQVIYYPSQGLPYLVTYDANTSQFIYWSNLLYLQGYSFITKIQALPTEMQNFPFYEPKPISQEDFQRYWQLYKKACGQFLYYRLLRSEKGVQDLFLRSCYEMCFSLQAMPPYVGIPTKNAIAIPRFSIEWQTIFLHFCRQLKLQPHELCKGDIQLFLHQLELEATNAAIEAVKNYMEMLQKVFNDQTSFQSICEQVYGHLFHN